LNNQSIKIGFNYKHTEYIIQIHVRVTAWNRRVPESAGTVRTGSRHYLRFRFRWVKL